MSKDIKNIEKACAFFASDYHFEMISLPYIDKSLEQNREVIILTENDLDKTIEVLVSKINLKDEKKKRILEINWKQDNLNKFKKIRKEIKNNKEITVLIKGKKNYINNVNQNIERWVDNKKTMKVIDCYDIEEIGDSLNEIMKDYEKILSTIGEKEINKI